MSDRLKTLKHLLGVYEAIEEMRSIELQRAAAAVREAEQAFGQERAIMQVATIEGRLGLLEGDRKRHTLAVGQQEFTDRRRMRLEGVLNERQDNSNRARKEHLDSRQWSERMKKLVERTSARVTELEEKRTQASADDRYLSRRRWKQSGKHDGSTSR